MTVEIDVDPLVLTRIETAQSVLEILGPISETYGEAEALRALLTAVAVASYQTGVPTEAAAALTELVPLVEVAGARVGEGARSIDLLVELYCNA